MLSSESIRTRSMFCVRAVTLTAVSSVVLLAGCTAGAGGGGGDNENEDMETPKRIQVRFDTFDVGTDDCEDVFSFGDFNVRMSVTIQPGNDEFFVENRGFELGSAALQATVQSADLDRTADFELQPGESFDVEVRVTEDDPINSGEPQPWEESESYDYLTVSSESLSFTNGPDCFTDDRVDITITVTE